MLTEAPLFCMVYKMPFLLLLSVLFTSCIHNPKKGEFSPKVYFDKALYYKEKRNYIEALEKLRELRKYFFYSSYNQKALLLTADIYFAQDKYPQAAESYEKHLNLYPKKQKDYVLYQIGLSYKNQLPHRSDHDLSQAQPALKAFNALLNLKGDSPYKAKTQIEKQNILDKKASKELKIAVFYKKQEWNQASFNRIQYFIKNYPNSPLMPKALLEGFQLAKLLNKNPEEFKEKLIKNYPDSQEIKAIHEAVKGSTFSKWKQKLL